MTTKITPAAQLRRFLAIEDILIGFSDGIDHARLEAALMWAKNGGPANQTVLDLFASRHHAAKEEAGWRGNPANEAMVDIAKIEKAEAEEGQRVTADSLTQSVTDETMRALLSCKDVGTGRVRLAAIINALSTTPARAEAQDEDTPCTDCGDTGVTHQTERRCSCQEAEAQDEGAAGERERIARHALNRIYLGHAQTPKETARLALDEMDAAHPSPTPAADADRVRIAVELINAEINAPLTGPTHGAWDRGRIAGLKEALAALKSTAAPGQP